MDSSRDRLILSELISPTSVHKEPTKPFATDEKNAGRFDEHSGGIAEALSHFYLIQEDSERADSSDASDSSSSPPSDSVNDSQPSPKRRALATDNSGDLVLRRRRGRQAGWRAIRIRHVGHPTPLADVGLQVWRGACLLCDWLLAQPGLGAPGTLVLELGGGVGLVGVAAAAVCSHVTITDVHAGALQLAAANLTDNEALVAELRRRRQLCKRRSGVGRSGHVDAATKGSQAGPAASTRGGVQVDVCELDWFDFLTFGSSAVPLQALVGALREGVGGGAGVGAGSRAAAAVGGPDPAGAGHIVMADLPVTSAPIMTTTPGDPRVVSVTCGGGVARVLDAVAAAETLCLVAADTVYDTVLTEAFVKCAAALMSYHALVRGGAASGGLARARERNCDDDAHRRSGGGSGVRLIVALEKRINFVVKDMAAGAPAFDDFMSYVVPEQAAVGTQVGAPSSEAGSQICLKQVQAVSKRRGGPARDGSSGGGGGGGSSACTGTGKPAEHRGQSDALTAAAATESEWDPALAPQRRSLFRGRQLALSAVPQVLQYERNDQLELWELTLL